MPEPVDPDATELPLESEKPDEIENLVAQCVERSERDGDPAVAEVCAQRPDLLRVVERRVAMLRRMGLLPGQTRTSPSAKATRKAEYPDMLGDFRLLEKIGGGGMGVVFRARQESLGREVALKLIRPEHLYFEGTKGRFRREVDAVARLNHPGIVPIFMVGEDEGVPYYAMERVLGRSLSEMIDVLRPRSLETLTAADLVAAAGAPEAVAHEIGARLGPSYIQGCVRIIAQVAEALAHAHERGVGHRDVKSSNILLTHDGRAVLVDFGLATLRGASKLTQTGSALGSPHYMAPEIWAQGGEAADFRSDVYSLGVTLYELLTLSLPFCGTSEEVMVRVLAGEFDAIRTRNPLVPWDVETVTLKAMELDRERRYPSATAFADDLRALLELRPIAAARPSLPLRIRRFAQRRPGTAMSIVLAFLVLGVFPAMAALVLGTKNRQIEAARDVAERNRNDMLRALDAMLIGVTDRELSDLPGISIVRKRMLEQALSVVDGLTGSERQERGVKWRVLQIERGVVQLAMSVGDREKAFAHSTNLVSGLESLLREDPNGPELFESLAEARLTRAHLLVERGEFTPADSLIARVKADLLPGFQARSDSAQRVALYLEALSSELDSRHDQADLAGLDRIGDEISEAVEVAIERFPEDVANRVVGLRVLSAFALVRTYSIGDGVARRALDRCVELADAQRSDEAMSLTQSLDSILTTVSVADALWQFREHARAIELLERALPAVRVLAEKHPDRIGPHAVLARVLTNLAESRGADRDGAPRPRAELEQAKAEFEEAIAVTRRVYIVSGESSDRAAEFAALLGSYADLLVNLDRAPDALPVYEEAERLMAAFARNQPLSLANTDNRIVNLTEYGRALSRAGRDDEAESRLADALRTLEEAVNRDGIDPRRAQVLALSNRSTLIEVLARSQRLSRALEEISRIDAFAAEDATGQVEIAGMFARCVLLLEDAKDSAVLRDDLTKAALVRLESALELGAQFSELVDDERFAVLHAASAWKEFVLGHRPR